ncbi:MAG: cytidylate kinase-like family protein [Eubacteriales bacterium]|nr:cytidylate kinase-like family protein [Eubacteriales bacterium]
MKKIVTISRQFGAAGGTIGYELARRLGYEYYDKELVLMLAARSNIDTYSLLKWDEHVPLHFGFAQTLMDFYNRPMSDRIFAEQTEVIRQVAEKGDCVIVGRNANSVLKEYDHCLHVFIHADTDWRVRHMKEKKMAEQSEAQILDELRKVDKARAKHCAYHTNTTFGDAKHYNLCLDSSRFGIEKSIDIIQNMLEEI